MSLSEFKAADNARKSLRDGTPKLGELNRSITGLLLRSYKPQLRRPWKVKFRSLNIRAIILADLYGCEPSYDPTSFFHYEWTVGEDRNTVKLMASSYAYLLSDRCWQIWLYFIRPQQLQQPWYLNPWPRASPRKPSEKKSLSDLQPEAYRDFWSDLIWTGVVVAIRKSPLWTLISWEPPSFETHYR